MDNDSVQWVKKRKKKEKNEDVVKKKKVHGEEHVNHVGKSVAAKRVGNDCKFIKN